MVTSRLYKLALGLVGTVILGAISAGLWDAVFKPAIPCGLCAYYFDPRTA
jgi:hypothetical protein